MKHINSSIKKNLSNLYWKTQIATGSLIMSIDAMAAGTSSDPLGASGSANNLGTSVTSLNTNLSGVPLLLLNCSQIFGIYMGWKAWDNWSKVQKGEHEAKPAKTAGYGLAAIGGYFLPSMLGAGGATILPGV
ncbi:MULTISPECIES: hypothetical protein [Pseudomonas]|uniref:Uncharacterized protein n=2 Tax=Pseudomonas TaxID=286 RepID=A0A2X2C8T9_PSELU|nr:MULTISPECIES: hypothetical protein [Pseudomonas]SER21756.1 hypothetical protein SAMN05216409_11449 [Pseudomonas lutea]SPZ04932.1 Uncharacterised protein [Pseudomonas luteola]